MFSKSNFLIPWWLHEIFPAVVKFPVDNHCCFLIYSAFYTDITFIVLTKSLCLLMFSGDSLSLYRFQISDLVFVPYSFWLVHFAISWLITSVHDHGWCNGKHLGWELIPLKYACSDSYFFRSIMFNIFYIIVAFDRFI